MASEVVDLLSDSDSEDEIRYCGQSPGKNLGGGSINSSSDEEYLY